jgi:hypothetical protein
MIVVITGLWPKNKSHMKKLLSILCVSIIALTAASCKKETVVAPNNNQTILTSIKASDWKLEDDGLTYYANIDMPELDDYANKNYGVLVSLSYDKDIYEPISQVYRGISYSYTHSPGNIQIEIQASDYQTVIKDAPGGVNIKIVLVESNQ